MYIINFMRRYFFAIFCCWAIVLPAAPLQAQCNHDDNSVDAWYSWFKGYENQLVDYFPLSERDEMIIGDSVHLEMAKQFKLSDKYERQSYLDGIVKRLSPHVERKSIRYQIHVIDDNRTLNAFSIAGGHLYITSKMVEWTESEDELAFVIAHEMAHADQKHGIRKVQKVLLGETLGEAYLGKGWGEYGKLAGQMANAAPYGQTDEYEADREGALLASKAGYDPRKGLRFFEKMGSKENYDMFEKIVRSHPYSAERLKCLDIYLREELKR